MFHAGLDLSRHRLDVHVMSEDGSALKVTTPPPDRDGLRSPVLQVTRDCDQEEGLGGHRTRLTCGNDSKCSSPLRK
jgi:hypothetical protein